MTEPVSPFGCKSAYAKSASAAAAVHAGFCRPEEPVVVELDGGELEITVHKDGTVWMKGPAAFVFEAEVTMEGGE